MRYPVLLLVGALVALPAAAQKPAAKPAARPAPKPAKKAPGPDLPSKLPLSAPVAVVNGVKIPLTEYIDALSMQYGPKVREDLIGWTLLRQEAKRRKIVVTPADVQKVVDQIYQKTVENLGSEKTLADDLRNTRGWTPSDYRAVIRGQADLQVIREKLGLQLVKPADVKDAEIEKEYENRKEQFSQPDTINISYIVVNRPSDDDKEKESKDRAARLRAEAILKRIKEGANFETVAKAESDDKETGARGGKIPIGLARDRNPFGAAFEGVVYNSEVGLINQVIPTLRSFLVVRLDQKKEARTLPLAEVKDQLRTALLTKKREAALDELALTLRKKAKIETGKF